MELTIFISFVLILVTPCLSSRGDHTLIFQECLEDCKVRYCSKPDSPQPNGKNHWFSDMIGTTPWPCDTECIYKCTWSTVHAFLYYKHNVPQFYGKWPFVRFLGLQEPASAIFSFLNLLANIFGLIWFCRRVPKTAPMYYVWIVYGLACINAWFSSILFHSRETPATEIMDYLGGFSMIEVYCFACFCRILGPERKLLLTLIGLALFGFLLQHASFMIFVQFDYGYNMKVTVTMAVVNAVGWAVFSLVQWRKRPYVYKCLLTLVTLNALLLLEFLDFPPIWWTFDAHSLWHLGTIPLGFVWFSFVIDDCLYLHAASLDHFKFN